MKMILMALALTLGFSVFAAKPHAVLVIGTTHYNPGATIPALARELRGCGFKTTLIRSEENPEKNPKGLPGLEALATADVAVFYMRFLTLPSEQMKHIEDYLKSGKPVVGFRTSTHGFAYPKKDALYKWNHGFGSDALGTKYFIHGKGPTQVKLAEGAEDHEILKGIDLSKPMEAPGTLYLADLPKDAKVLLTGTGNFTRTGKITNGFGTHDIKPVMTDEVAWTWKNKWGGRVFATSLGHPGSFAEEKFVRFYVNGIHWAAGLPVPKADKKFETVDAGMKGRAKRQNVTRSPNEKEKKPRGNPDDGRNRQTGKKAEPKDPQLAKYAIFEKTAPRPGTTTAVDTKLPLALPKGTRIAFIGNTLLDRAQNFGHFEAALQQAFPKSELTVRNLTWAADQLGTEPRPANFADVEQHLTIAQADVIFAAYGFNESFAGESGLPEFRQKLSTYVAELKRKAFNGKSAPQIVLVSPIANENVKGVAAADRNNKNIAAYTKVMREVAKEQRVGFADVYSATESAMASAGSDLTINGCHLNDEGYQVFARELFKQTFGKTAPKASQALQAAVVEKNKQFFRRYRPVNTFYYTGGRNKSYGYLDFLPAMRNFDIMVQNRDRRIWDLAQGKKVPAKIDDSNVPPLPTTTASRGANKWMSPADELKAFKVDPRFEVNLFASEEEFPEIACPIQIRWDARGRMWVSCSTTYPHVYPGNEPDDKLVILEDTDGDGRADKSTVFADNLHIPLSFEFGDGGVYVSEEPHMTFIKDTDGDGKADYRRQVLTGFGCEDSHHALHDFVWSPDGDLIFRESIFHHSQIETPYGPVRQQNSGWFRFEPRLHRLTSFGTYHSTNPWGVTFDDWGQHVASHPIYAQAFHALDPVYPKQHPRPAGLRAYSGTCGQEFVDFASWPKEMQGGYVKVRYKPTNRVEFHKWKKTEFGYDEEYVGDIIFSSNLSFIPVDLRYGPRGAMYVCDWYNPIKGHAQYSLRDERRDRKSGRIWRILPKGAKLATPPKMVGESTAKLLNILKRPEYRYRYWAKRELRERDPQEVKVALDKWVGALNSNDARHRHHQMEAVWMYRNIESENIRLLAELLDCEKPEARAAATHQLRYWHASFKDGDARLRKAANDKDPIVRMEAAIATSYIGTPKAMDALADTTKHPHGGHLAYGMRTALGASTMLPHWQFNHHLTMHNAPLRKFISEFAKNAKIATDVNYSAKDAQFDSQKNLKVVRITTIKERMLYDVTRFEVKAGQPVKLEFINPDATPHNLVIVKPGSGDEVGLGATRMAADPELAKSGQYIPKSDKVLFHTKMVPPIAGETLRFMAPTKPGQYPYVCTFPGHWTIMKGVMVVK